MEQVTRHIMMVRPSNFGFNSETAASNVFQNRIREEQLTVQAKALIEFNEFYTKLKANDINVYCFDDTEQPEKPDAVFPNNWVSFHHNGKVILYPMQAQNRRWERRSDLLEAISNTFSIQQVIDLSNYENQNQFLEGTGSIVFDHQHQIAYACYSIRTHRLLFENLCTQIGYQPIGFTAVDQNGTAIYHTNVIMTIGEQFAVVCLASLQNTKEKDKVVQSLELTGHTIIDISLDQVNQFAGNMLTIQNNQNESFLVLSETAYDSLSTNQKKELNQYANLLPINIKTIETIGGGSVRCMLAEIFLPLKN